MNPVELLLKKINSADLWERNTSLNRNEFLKVQGSIDTNLYFVITGAFRVFITEEYEEHTIRFGYKDNIIGALDSFITDQPSDLHIQALKKSEVKSITKSVFMDFINADDENVRIWQSILEGLVYQQMERERDILTSSPLERYKRVLKRSPQLFQEIPNKYIASYLRMTPETLSRLKKS